MKFKSEVQLEALNNATVDTDKFLVSDSSTVKYRTGAQVLSDIGGQAALTNPITGTGTLNYVSKFTSATSLGNSLIYDDGTNVGIGTTTPLSGGGAAKWLTVNGTTYGGGFISSVNGTQKGVLYYDNASETFAMYAPTSVGATIHTNGSERMRITSAGDVGIGTLSPGYKLDVNGVINTNAFFRIGDATTIGGIGSANAIFGAGGNDWVFYNPNATSNVFYTSGTERMRITSGGNVGIGTSSPSEMLEVQNGGSGTKIKVSNSAGGYASLECSSNATSVAQLSFTNQLSLIGGNVGIGTTSPSEKLHVSGNTLITGTLEVDTVNNGVGDFLTRTAGGIVTRRTAAEVRSDIGAQAALTNPVTGTGTLNFVSKFTSTGSTLGNSQIFDDGSSIGIGTSGPLNKVDIVSSNNDSFGAITVRPSNQTQTMSLGWQGVSASLNFIVNTGAVERMRITSAGNVGIGTTVPDTLLHISSLNSSILRLESTNTALGLDAVVGEIQFEANDASGSGTGVKAKIGAYSDVAAGNAVGLRFFTGDAGFTTGTEKMRILASGNVGIGTTTPTAIGTNITTLDIKGSSGGGVRSGVAGGSESTFYTITAGGYLGTISNIPLNFQTNNSVKATILANGHVGIGTTNPTSRVHSVTNSSGPVTYDNRCAVFGYNTATETTFNNGVGIAGRVLTSGGMAVYGDATTGGGWGGYFDGKGYFSGNVGIGTTAPVDKLDVNGAMRFRANTPSFTAVTNSGVIDFVPTTVFPTDPQIRFCAVGTATVGASMVFQTGTTSASIGEVMRITSTGNVGIGTTVPAVRLNVAGGDAAFDFGGFGNIPAAKLLRAGDEPTLRFYRPSGGTPNARIFQIQNTVGDLTFGYALANKYSESTFTEAMRITSLGTVGIGTSSPVRALQVGGFSGNPEICIGSGTTGFGSLIFGDSASGNDPWRGFVQYNHATDAMIIGTANASWLTLTSGGALGLNVNPTNTAGRFEASNDIVAYSSSDRRWKTNIKNIDSPLEKISQINGVEFDWIEDEPVHGNKGHDIGVIAQEIENILPDAVQTRESGMKAVKYEKVIPLLIEAIKEQQKQIEELKQLLNGITN